MVTRPKSQRHSISHKHNTTITTVLRIKTMVLSRPYFIIPDAVLAEDVIENLFNKFSLQLTNVPNGSPTPPQLGTAFTAVLTFVRDLYKAHFQGLDKDFALREQSLNSQIGALTSQIGPLNNQLSQLRIEKKRVDQRMDYKKATSARLKTELAEARTGKREAEIQHDTTCAMLKLLELQLVNQGKVIDRLLLNGLSRVKPNQDDPLSVSISKSTLWQTQQNVPGNHFSVPLKELQLPQHSNPAVIHAKCEDLLSIDYPKEPPMYEPFTKFLDDYLSDTDFLVFNTSQCYYLDGFAPDITISLPRVAAADAMAMVLFVELKARDGKVLGNDHNLGQIYEYLLAAARCQRERSKFAGILSNFGQNIAVVLSLTDTRVYLTHYIGANMHTILRFVTAILEDQDCHPPNLEFSQAIGPMFSRLGQVSASIVGEFSFLEMFPASVNVAPVPIPDSLMTAGSHPARMAVKWLKHFTEVLVNVEAHVFLEIRRLGSHPNLPYIVMLSEDHSEIGTLPVSAPISSSTLSIPGIGSTIIDNILDALTFLHSRKIIHRDVRTVNVILHGRTAILIDFDAAAPTGVLTTHMGGFICTPQDVLRNPGHQYIPKPADDMLAVLMVNSLLFPSVYRNFQSMKMSEPGSEEHSRVVGLWAALRASTVRGPLVTAAEANRVDVLRAGLQALMVTL